jgi:hypothetical protein
MPHAAIRGQPRKLARFFSENRVVSFAPFGSVAAGVAPSVGVMENNRGFMSYIYETASTWARNRWANTLMPVGGFGG